MLCVEDFEKYAEEHMDKAVYAFYSMGAEKELTIKDNMKAFNRYVFVPRMLRNVPSRDLSVTVLGEKIGIPIALAPTAYQRLVHPDGEIAAARAAAKMKTIYTLSSVATTSAEDIAKAVPHGTHWMQLYVTKDRKVTEGVVRRAEVNGFKAIVLTVDTPFTGLQLKIRRQKLYLPPHLDVPNLPEVMEKVRASGSSPKGLACGQITSNFCHTLTWEDVRWLRSMTKLPIVLKGILTAEDAKMAVECGAAAVWISNHGGRQLDGTYAAIDAVEEIAKELKGTNCEIYMDGGIRWGSDVLKALALGVRTVFIGRPLAWGLAYDGENGVLQVLQVLKDELNLAMNLAGCRDFSDVGSSLLQKRCPCKL